MIKKYSKNIFLMIFLFLMTADVAFSFSAPASKLKEYNINLGDFTLLDFSPDNNSIIGVEIMKDLKLRAKGLVTGLKILILDKDKIKAVDTLLLPVSIIEQAKLSANGKEMLITGEKGTKILLVNLEKKKVSILYNHKKGEEGFRSEPLAWQHNDKFYLYGYFYNKESESIGDYIVELDSKNTGSQMFIPKINMAELFQKIEHVKLFTMVSSSQGYFTQLNKNSMSLILYDNGNITKLDEDLVFGGVAASLNKVFYAIKRSNGERELIVQNTKNNTKISIAKGDKAYSYLDISKNGKTITYTLFDFKSEKMNYFYGRESEGFILKSIPSLQGVEFGIFRLSPDGTKFAFLSGKRFVVENIPK